MAKRTTRTQYQRDYYHAVRGPKTVALKKIRRQTCQVCGEAWGVVSGGWAETIFACESCAARLAQWDAERPQDLCQVCVDVPAEGLDETTQLRCCMGCYPLLLAEARSQLPTGEVQPDPWLDGEKLKGHIFEKLGLPFEGPDAIASLCGAKAPIRPLRMDMTMPSALRRWGLCVACLQACPDPPGLAWKDRNYFAYVIPVGQAQEIAPAVGTS